MNLCLCRPIGSSVALFGKHWYHNSENISPTLMKCSKVNYRSRNAPPPLHSGSRSSRSGSSFVPHFSTLSTSFCPCWPYTWFSAWPLGRTMVMNSLRSLWSESSLSHHNSVCGFALQLRRECLQPHLPPPKDRCRNYTLGSDILQLPRCFRCAGPNIYRSHIGCKYSGLVG